MGFFKKIRHAVTRVSQKVTKAKNWAKPIVTKVKHGWSKAGQAGRYLHSKIMPKLKTGLTIASALPIVGSIAAVGLEGVSAADQALGTALATKARIDKTAGRLDQYSQRIGKYSNISARQIKKGDMEGLINTARSAVKEGRNAYKIEKGNFQRFKKSYAFDTKRGQDMRDHFN